MDAAPALVDRLDPVRRRGTDRLIVAVADHEIVFHDAPKRRQRQQVRHHGRAVLAADIESEAIAGDTEMQREGTPVGALRREQVLLDQVVDRDRALMLDVGTGTADRFLIERDCDDAAFRIVSWRRRGHGRLRRIPTERAWASSPSALPSVIATGPSARN